MMEAHSKDEETLNETAAASAANSAISTPFLMHLVSLDGACVRGAFVSWSCEHLPGELSVFSGWGPSLGQFLSFLGC